MWCCAEGCGQCGILLLVAASLSSWLEQYLRALLAFINAHILGWRRDAGLKPAAPLPSLQSTQLPSPPPKKMMEAPPVSLLAHTSASYVDAVAERLGRGHVLARALYTDFWTDGVLGARCTQLAGAPELALQLLAASDGSASLRFARSAPAPPAAGETEKYALVAHDGLEVEMVAMPAPGAADVWSLCVSSQVGCAQGCAFCETGRMGLLRNLTAAEIVSQLYLARFALGLRVANVVFMGMGEPLDNLDAVIAAVQVMTDALGAKLPMSSVTISTSGDARLVPPLMQALPRVRMAFSLHAADDATRSRLMPINRC